MRYKPPASRALSAVIALSVVSGAPASEAAAAIARTSIPASLPPAAVRPVIAVLPLSVSATASLPSLNLPVFSPLSSVPLPAGPAAVPSISVSPGAVVIRRPTSVQAHLSLIRATGAIATQPAQPGAAPKAELVELSRVSTDKKGGIAAAFGAIFDGRRPLDGASPVKAGENAADRAADLLKGDDKAELFLPGFYWGGLELDALAKAPVNLGAPEQAWLDAYKALVRYGLRPKATSESDAAKLRAALAVPAMSGVLASVGTTLRELEIPVMDTKAIDDDNDIPQEVLKRAVTLGLHRLKFPKEFGGLGLRQREYVQVLETVVPISAALVAQLGAQNTIGTAPLTMFGTRAQQEKYLPRLSNGEGLVSFGLTEPLAGTDLDRLGTTAVLQDGRWRLSGQKIFITGIMDAQLLYLVAGHTIVDGKDLGPTVFIVDDLGFKADESWAAKKKNLLKLAGRGMRITPWTRDGFEIPYGSVLGPVGKDAATGMDGKKVPLRSLNKGRAGFAYLGESARWFAERQLEWAADRRMFDLYAPHSGEPGRQGFMEFPATLIGRSRMKAEVLKVLSKYSAALIDAHPEESVAALSALIKVRASQWNWENALDTLELGGGHVLIKDAPGRVYQSVLDSWIARIVEGVNPAMSQFPHMMAGGKVMREMGSAMGFLKAGWRQTVNLLVPFAVTSKGALGWRQAKWIQKRTAEFAVRFAMSALILGVAGFVEHAVAKGQYWRLFWPPAILAGVMKASQVAFARHQNTLIRAFEAQADILSLAMVETELNTDKGMDPTRRFVLEKAVEVLRREVRRSLSDLTPWGNPVENAQAAVGRRLMSEALEDRGDRPDRVRQHLDFLERTSDEFHARLRAEAGHE